MTKAKNRNKNKSRGNKAALKKVGEGIGLRRGGKGGGSALKKEFYRGEV